jgi:hypothetical protein
MSEDTAMPITDALEAKLGEVDVSKTTHWLRWRVERGRWSHDLCADRR